MHLAALFFLFFGGFEEIVVFGTLGECRSQFCQNVICLTDEFSQLIPSAFVVSDRTPDLLLSRLKLDDPFWCS